MGLDSESERRDFSLEQVKRQLQALSAVEPPAGLREKLLAGVSPLAARKLQPHVVRRWSRGASWTGIAAAIIVTTSVMVWLSAPSGRPARPIADTNCSPGRIWAADFNGVLPPDTNTSDSNGLF